MLASKYSCLARLEEEEKKNKMSDRLLLCCLLKLLITFHSLAEEAGEDFPVKNTAEGKRLNLQKYILLICLISIFIFDREFCLRQIISS